MKTYFYSHIVTITSIADKLEQMALSAEEKEELLQLVEETMHHNILEHILSQLNEEDKDIFLRYLIADEQNQLWDYLESKIENIQESIITKADAIKKIFLDDLADIS